MSAELCTDQGDRIRTAFESFNDFGYESVIFFRPNEVELVGREHSGVVDVRLMLPAEKIRETGGSYKYESDEPQIELGIRTKVVATALKRFAPGDRVIIGARKGTQREFYVICRGKNKDFTAEIVAPFMGPNIATPNLCGVFKYAGSIVMGSGAFHCIIGDLLTANPPVIEFECDGSSLKVAGEGMFSKSSVRIGQARVFGPDSQVAAIKQEPAAAAAAAGDGDSADDSSSGEENVVSEREASPTETAEKRQAEFRRDLSQLATSWNVRRSYATLHLSRIAKAKNMSSKITISLSQDAPASFEYDTPIGRLTYVVCARSVEDIDDPKLKAPNSNLPPAAKRARFAVKEPEAEFDSDGMGDDDDSLRPVPQAPAEPIDEDDI